jgi:class 3 adenylate cyclase
MPPDKPAPGTSPGQRTLAAIVFTDVVSFSARMHSDEVGTLRLLQRDFAEMRRLCADFEGQVLKTTGDGLLLTFTSAVQAVACALAMQRQFAAEAKGQPSQGGALQHRIGIHLGDVLVQDQDVMGDGVNIASRLQAEAEPGGICISQTVYDVVKNKLEMKVVSLGARDLKNIAQAMPVYRLLLDAQTLDPASKGASPAPGPAASRPRRWVLAAAGAAAALAAAIATVVILSRRAPANPRIAATVQPPAAPAAPSTAPAPPAQVAAGAAGSDLADNLASEYNRRRDVTQQLHALYLDKYDFSGLVLALRDKGESPSAPPSVQQTLRAAEQLVRMKKWLDLALGRYSAQHPLQVRDLSGDSAKDVSLYLAPDERVVLMENGAPRPRDWVELKPEVFGAIIVSAVREAKEPPRAALFGAQAFARFYALPSMTEALASIKAQRQKSAPPR